MKEQLAKIRAAALEAIADSNAAAALDSVRVKYLGKKGELTSVLKQMGKLLDSLEDNDDVQNVWHSLENEEDLPE